MIKNTTKVYPTSHNSMVISHPIDGRLNADGVEWTKDGFTARCLTDGAITTDAAKAWKSTTRADQHPPAHATGVSTADPKVTTRKAAAE